MRSFLIMLAMLAASCDGPPTSDELQQSQQERLLMEGTAQSGMPGIKNFRERKLMKDILELRDREGYVTYTYVFSEVDGTFHFFCQSIGYPIPYATQYTNPQKTDYTGQYGIAILPQADPNGLFSPASAEGTWVMCKDPTSEKVGAVYSEPKLTTLPWPMPGVPMGEDISQQH